MNEENKINHQHTTGATIDFNSHDKMEQILYSNTKYTYFVREFKKYPFHTNCASVRTCSYEKDGSFSFNLSNSETIYGAMLEINLPVVTPSNSLCKLMYKKDFIYTLIQNLDFTVNMVYIERLSGLYLKFYSCYMLNENKIGAYNKMIRKDLEEKVSNKLPFTKLYMPLPFEILKKFPSNLLVYGSPMLTCRVRDIWEFITVVEHGISRDANKIDIITNNEITYKLHMEHMLYNNSYHQSEMISKKEIYCNFPNEFSVDFNDIVKLPMIKGCVQYIYFTLYDCVNKRYCGNINSIEFMDKDEYMSGFRRFKREEQESEEEIKRVYPIPKDYFSQVAPWYHAKTMNNHNEPFFLYSFADSKDVGFMNFNSICLHIKITTDIKKEEYRNYKFICIAMRRAKNRLEYGQLFGHEPICYSKHNST